jgi:4a-hydroxytetrahydrobiopterin dehydratase
MTEELAKRRCTPCEGGIDALSTDAAEQLLKGLHEGWTIGSDGLSIRRRFEFPAYSRTLGFANAVAWIAIAEGHHPVLTVCYGTCDVEYSTHAVNGLTANDFICAAKIDRIPQ